MCLPKKRLENPCDQVKVLAWVMGSRLEYFKEPNIQTTSFAKTKYSRPLHLPEMIAPIQCQQSIESYDMFIKQRLEHQEGIGMHDGV